MPRTTVFVESDGPLIDVEPVFWAAYSKAVQTVGLARTDRAGFWRQIRRADSMTPIVLGAKPRHQSTFKLEFESSLESDDCWTEARARDEATQPLARIAQHAFIQAVTIGRNRHARGRILESSGLDRHLMGLLALPADPDRRVDRIKNALAAAETETALFVAAGPSLIHAAQGADVPVVGLSNGSATAAQLRKTGLDHVMSELQEIADALDHGGAFCFD